MPSMLTRKIIAAIQSSRWLHKLSIFTLAIFLIFIHIRLYQYAFDDAFIHFRIARNLFETGKPYFNVNEAVKVSTSSGWVIFLTILFSILHLFNFEDGLPMLVCITNALATLGGLFVYGKIIGRLSKNQPSFLTTILFYAAYIALVIPSSIGLMEIPFGLFIVGLGIYCLLSDKTGGFILLAVAAYLRLEFAIVLVLVMILSMRNLRLRNMLAFSLVGVAPFLIFDLYSFHTFIPESIIAKSIVYLTTWEQTAGNILFFSFPTIFGDKNNVFLVSAGILFLSILFLAGQSAVREWRSHANVWPLFFWAWGMLIMAGYVLGHAFMFDWYFPLYTVPILVAFFLSLNDAQRPQRNFMNDLLALVALISIVSISQTIFASVSNPNTFSLFAGGSRVKTYLQLGETLYKEYPNAALLSPEIGGLGYSFRGQILDPLGLASPEALQFQTRQEAGAIPPAYVRKKMPEIIISYDIFAQSLLHNELIAQYQTVQFPAYLPSDALYSKDKTMFGSEYLRVYIRKDLLSPSLDD
jgi:hypothetical protein